MNIEYVSGKKILFPVYICKHPKFENNHVYISKHELCSPIGKKGLIKELRTINTWYSGDAKDIFSYFFVNSQRFVIDSNGKAVNTDYLYNLAFFGWTQEKSKKVSCGFKRSTGHCFRNPKTLNEMRSNALVYYYPEIDVSEPPIRGARTPVNIVTSWDDAYIKHHKNWKSQRKTQWK